MEPKEEIRQKIDLVDYIGKSVRLKSSGRTFKGLCPFHSEKSPSFIVSAERQSFKCFGCGEGGDIFSFYMKQEGVTFPEALKDLAQQTGVELTQNTTPQDFDRRQRLFQAHQDAAAYYHYLLTKHNIGKLALAYAHSRHITNQQLKSFQVGYALNNWDGLTKYMTKKKQYACEELELAGLTIRGDRGAYDRFRGRLVFPLYDVRGNIVGFSGRVLPEFDDGKSGKYINSPETPIYHKSQHLFGLYQHKEAIRQAKYVVLVEGELDVLASERAKVGAVVAIKGSVLTEEQARLIKRFTPHLYLALDADVAGVAAAKRAIEVAQHLELNIRVVHLVFGKDPDELVASNPKAWRQAVKTAVPAYDFLIEIATKTQDVTTAAGKQVVTTELIPLLNQIENAVVADHYIEQVSQKMGVSKEVIIKEMQRQHHARSSKRETALLLTQANPTLNRLDRLTQEWLIGILQNYPNIDWERVYLKDMPLHSAIKIGHQLSISKSKSLMRFADHLPAELQAIFDQAYLQIDEQSYSHIDLEGLALEIAKRVARDTLSQLRSQLHSATQSEHEHLTSQVQAVLLRLRSYNKQN